MFDWRLWMTSFSERLVKLRKQRGLTQKEFAEALDMHATHVRRYEKGTCQPTLNVLIKMAKVLSVSADTLIFGKDSRGPSEDFRLQFEALSALDEEEKQIVRAVLDGLILKHEAKRWSKSS